MMIGNKKMDLDEFLASLMKTERPSKFPLSMYYTEGTKYLNLFQYKKALEFLNEAVSSDPMSIISLLKRSKCFICLRRYEEALKDANLVLKLYPDHVQAIHLKGQAQYMMGDYEGGYLTYMRGWKMKPVRPELRLGKQLCEDALKNLHPRFETKIKETDIADISKAGHDKKKFEDGLKYKRSSRECFGADIKFLQGLLKDKNLASVHGICEETIEFIKHRERFWCMEAPLHSRKKIEKIVTKEFKKPDPAEKQMKFCRAANRRARKELLKGRIDSSISEAKKVLNATKSFPKQREKDKMKLRCDAYHFLGLAYREVDNSHLAFQYLLKELEIASEYNMMLPETRAYHKLGEMYQAAGDIGRSLQCLDKVITAMSPESIEEMTTDAPSAEEEWQMQEAISWASSVISGVRLSLRESILSPIVDTNNQDPDSNVEKESRRLQDKEGLSESKSDETDILRDVRREEAQSLGISRTEEDRKSLPELRKEDLRRKNELENVEETTKSDELKSEIWDELRKLEEAETTEDKKMDDEAMGLERPKDLAENTEALDESVDGENDAERDSVSVEEFDRINHRMDSTDKTAKEEDD